MENSPAHLPQNDRPRKPLYPEASSGCAWLEDQFKGLQENSRPQGEAGKQANLLAGDYTSHFLAGTWEQWSQCKGSWERSSGV